MHINTRLKVEECEEKTDMSHWLVADLFKDPDTEKRYYVTTDYVPASELIINPKRYAKLFAQAPDMYFFLKDIITDLDREKQIECKKILDEVKDEIPKEIEVSNGQLSIYDEMIKKSFRKGCE